MHKTKTVPVEVVSWGPNWDAMKDAAQKLGAMGIMFQIKWTTPEEERRGIDILPEIHLYDKRFRVHICTPGLYVVVHPGERNFRVVDKETLEAEYEVRTDDLADSSR